MGQPIGAMYALFGVHAAVPLVHGSQGCAAYPMRMFNRHFGELVQVAVSSLGEDASVFGGKKNLIAAIENIIARRHPELIGVITTCLSETIAMTLTESSEKGILKTRRWSQSTRQATWGLTSRDMTTR